LNSNKFGLLSKRELPTGNFIRWSKKKIWDGFISFIDKYQRIPVGLWNELNDTCAKYGFPLEVEGIGRIIDYDFDEHDFRKWVNEFFSDHPTIKPRDYQIEAAIPIIKYRRSISEIATSAGKTLIIFMIFAYLRERGKNKKFMMVVPNTNLILQTLDDFDKYNNKLEFTTQAIHGGTDKTKQDADFVIGTYQSLVKRDRFFFDDVTTICIDEAHGTQASSIKKIIINCMNTTYAFGVSGTMLQNGSTEALTIQAYLGPLVNNISASFLTSNNYATPIYIKVVILDYLEYEAREKLEELRSRKAEIEGSKLLEIEKRLVVENRNRFSYICNFISKSTKNSLVLFQNIKDSYGRRIYDHIRENTRDKTVFYVDGSTPIDIREDYIARMEDGDDKILVASFGCFSTGISINAIHNVFFVESYKSEKIIRQSIGRGMRLMKGKERTNIIDFVDDFSLSKGNKNYLLKHGDERQKIYKEQGFPYKIYKVKF
jgi:superfamily II DNA or RNA helicase